MERKTINIDIPNNLEIDWDESKKQNRIVLKDKQLTYEDVCKKLFSNGGYFINVAGGICHSHSLEGLEYQFNNATTEHQLECILAKNKLANVAKYLNDGWKPNKGDMVFMLSMKGDFENSPCVDEYYFGAYYSAVEYLTIFKTKELAQQAFEILGEETIKLALEPLGI